MVVEVHLCSGIVGWGCVFHPWENVGPSGMRSATFLDWQMTYPTVFFFDQREIEAEGGFWFSHESVNAEKKGTKKNKQKSQMEDSVSWRSGQISDTPVTIRIAGDEWPLDSYRGQGIVAFLSPTICAAADCGIVSRVGWLLRSYLTFFFFLVLPISERFSCLFL